MDEIRNIVLIIAGIVTIIKNIYDIWQKESEKREAREEQKKALPPDKQEALKHSKTRGVIPLLLHYITSTMI
ncbi:hypothetical protein [Bacillus velezensis]|uniref:hypothetical protein n=1 Tax=Bacillus velezensis TaxID=492670 RepID=UPI001F23B946|nr:hypothetical protein [Bacillus velezensis]UJA34267.1 hypothetical protein L0961_10560 [Bacillus velezensis]